MTPFSEIEPEARGQFPDEALAMRWQSKQDREGQQQAHEEAMTARHTPGLPRLEMEKPGGAVELTMTWTPRQISS